MNLGNWLLEHISYHKQLMKTMLCLLNILVITIKQKFQILVPDSTHALDIEEPPVPRRVAAKCICLCFDSSNKRV